MRRASAVEGAVREHGFEQSTLFDRILGFVRRFSLFREC